MDPKQKKYRMKTDVVFQPMDDSAIIVSLNSEEIYKLNSTGTTIAELISKGNSLQDILTSLEETYDIDPHQLEREVDELIQGLSAAGLIEEEIS